MRNPLIILALLTAAGLGGCNNKVSSDGVLERAAVQPPPSERNSGLGTTAPAPTTPAADDDAPRGRRGLSVPAR
jgi:hypothetical protein